MSNNLLENKQFVLGFHLFVVAPLIWLMANNKLEEQYKQYVIILSYLLAAFYIYKLIYVNTTEGFDSSYNGLHHIKMFDSSPGYDKPHLTVKSGDVVVWTNVGELEHTVTDVNLEFNSGYLKPGEVFAVKFIKKGTYQYRCLPHSGWMIGVIVVE